MAKKKTVKKTVKTYAPPPQMAPGAFVDSFDVAKSFFTSVRDSLGPLRQLQVDGMKAILAAWIDSKLTDTRWLAYMFATVWHETATTCQPITEYGSSKYLRSKKYWPYIGRGFVQLTWKANYVKYGIDKTPERALEPATAAHIMIDGMTNGVFTGKKLSDYFNDKKEDAVGARRIINGTDRARMIAGHYQKFAKALAKPLDQKLS